MNRSVRYIALAAAAFGSAAAYAANTSTQSFSVGTEAINEISVSGNPGNLVVRSATAGQAPAPVTDSSTTWAITTNAGTDMKKLTAKLDSNMPSGLTLTLNVINPTGGVSAGEVDISATGGTALAQNVITGIDSVNESALGLTYKLSATVNAGVVALTARTVTLTLSD